MVRSIIRESAWQLELKGDVTRQRRLEAVDKLMSVLTLVSCRLWFAEGCVGLLVLEAVEQVDELAHAGEGCMVWPVNTAADAQVVWGIRDIAAAQAVRQMLPSACNAGGLLPRLQPAGGGGCVWRAGAGP